MLSNLKAQTLKALRWLWEKIAAHLLEILLLSAGSIFAYLSQWRDTLLMTPIIQWPGLTMTTVLVGVVLVSASLVVASQRLFERFLRKPFIWTVDPEYKWKTWRSTQSTDRGPYCKQCGVKVVQLSNETLICSSCGTPSKQRWDFDYHELRHTAAHNEAAARIQGHYTGT